VETEVGRGGEAPRVYGPRVRGVAGHERAGLIADAEPVEGGPGGVNAAGVGLLDERVGWGGDARGKAGGGGRRNRVGRGLGATLDTGTIVKMTPRLGTIGRRGGGRGRAAWSAAACVVFVLIAPSRAAADFVVTSWALGSSVRDFSTLLGNQSFNGVPQPAFNQSLNSAYSNSVAQVAYAYNYSAVAGQFDADVHLEAQGGPDFRSGTDNQVRFIPSTDVLLTVEAQWQFQLAGGDRVSDFFITAGKWGFAASFMNHLFSSSTIFGGPSSATWTVHDSVLLPAGHEYFFRSIFRLQNWSGSPTALSVGNGYARFTLTTVPEPSGLLLVAVGGVLVAGRRRGLAWYVLSARARSSRRKRRNFV